MKRRREWADLPVSFRRTCELGLGLPGISVSGFSALFKIGHMTWVSPVPSRLPTPATWAWTEDGRYRGGRHLVSQGALLPVCSQHAQGPETQREVSPQETSLDQAHMNRWNRTEPRNRLMHPWSVKYKTWHHKTPRREHSQTFSEIVAMFS